MSLLASTESLIADAEAIIDTTRDRRRLAGLRGRSERLEAPAARYRRIRAKAAVMRAAGISLAAIPAATAIGRRANQVMSEFATNPESIIEPTEELRYAFWEQLGEVASEIERQLRAAWAEHVSSMVTHIDADLVDELPTVLANDKRRVADLQREINELKADAPETADAIERLGRLAVMSKDLASSLNLEALHPEVRAFVGAVARSTATLDLVTPAVIDWLRHYDLGSRFAVRFGRG